MIQPKEPVQAPIYNGGIALLPSNVTALYPSHLYYEIQPGDTLTDEVIVRNDYDHPASVYLGALDTTAEATWENYQLKNQYEEEQVTVGKWVTFSPEDSTLELESGETRRVEFELTIPEDTPFGTYMGAVYTDYAPEGQDGSIVTVLKTGLRTIINVTETPADLNYIETMPSAFWKNISYGYLSAIVTVLALILILFSQTDQFSKWFSR